jgi:hypothetical protein
LLLAAVVALKLYVAEVAPLMFVNVDPPFVDTCHWTLVLPVAAAVKVAVVPLQAIWFVGFVVTTGAVLTVSVAAVVFLDPQLFVNSARYCLLLSVDAVVKVRVVAVAPGTFVKFVPSVETCHCTDVDPVAAAVNVALAPAQTV